MPTGATFNITVTSTYASTSLPSISAQFDVLVYYNNSKSSIVPTIDASSSSISINSNSHTATVTWSVDTNPNDTYSVYQLNGVIPSGYIAGTACGAKLFMTNSTNSISISGGTATVEFTGLTSTSYIPVTPIVVRAGGYEAAYNNVVVGAASSITIPMAFILFAILLIM